MSVTYSSILLNHTNLYTEDQKRMESSEVKKPINLFFFCLSFVVATVTLIGGVYSLWSLLKMRRKTSLSLIVASMSIDDIISVIPISLFMLVQWERDSSGISGAWCTLSALLYIFQGLSSNMKASLIVAYTFYVIKRFGVFQSARQPLRVVWAIAAVWVISLIVSLLPTCGWGSFSPTSLGCFADSTSSYVILLFVLYLLCFSGFVVFSVPLTYQLLCSGEPVKTFYPNYLEFAGGSNAEGSVPLCEIPSLSRDSLEKSFEIYSEIKSEPACINNKVQTHACSTPNSQKDASENNENAPLFFAQKRFSFIIAMVRIVLWMPMMIQMFLNHLIHVRSPAFETLSFFLTLLSAAVTPVFVLSKRWIHLPCGCFINCRREKVSQSSKGKKGGLEFNLSFQQGYGIYTFNQTTPSVEKTVYHNLLDCHSTERKGVATDLRITGNESVATTIEDSSLSRENLSATCEARSDNLTYALEHSGLSSGLQPVTTQEDQNLDTSSVFEGPERRLSDGECREIELSDWEWCRTKSERTPRQRTSGGLAIPLCAFQGTVSLQAPTGKTLSLSTYEVSGDGLKISPSAKKVEVYRSKSVGHEPSAEELANGIGDTNVKIHLEVLEICDNEEAMDSVSIISNISQSSTHTRSPSLRYSRRENRFVSCDLGETASYSLLIPTSNPDSDINIHIPDTVEAHRQNSKRQHQERSGYQEEIQLLNEAYRRQDVDKEN